jgi:chromosome segregation ATPase
MTIKFRGQRNKMEKHELNEKLSQNQTYFIQNRIKEHEQEIQKCQDEIDSHKEFQYTYKIKIDALKEEIKVYKIRISELEVISAYIARK